MQRLPWTVDTTLFSIDPNQLPANLGLYARALQLEYGECRRLHYGLQQDSADATDCQALQEAFANKLSADLLADLAPASKVLLYGPSLGALGVSVAGPEIDVDWLHPAAVTTEVAGFPATLRQRRGDLAHPSLTASYHNMVVEGSFRYQDQLALLTRCRGLLLPGGRLLLFGEYLDDDSQIAYGELANLSSLRQLAVRLGFEVVVEDDFTADALASLAALQQLMMRHRDGLLQTNTTVQWLEAQSSLLAIEREMGSGRRCLRLFVLRRDGQETIHNPGQQQLGEWREAEYGDIDSFEAEEVAALFEKSFGKEFDPALWQWKYQQGGGKCVVARERAQAAIISHYGGAPRKILYFGRPDLAIQVCDVMVLPERRQYYGKSSLFFKTAATFLEREIGNTVRHLLGFGFPNRKAMKIALRLGLYEKTDDFIELVYGRLSQAPSPAHQLIEYDAADSEHRQALGRLWAAMREDFVAGIVGVRDEDYFRYRYLDHPHAGAYRRLLLRRGDSGRCLALAVLKRHEQAHLLMDLICPLQDMPAAIEQLLWRLQQEEALLPLKLWITKGWAERVELEGAVVNELGIEIPCNSWNPGPAAQTLYGAWWLTAGDMDFM